MKIIKVKKLFAGCVSIRDYDVAKGIKENGLVVQYQGRKMYLSPGDLKNNQMAISKTFFSKWGNQQYRLIDYLWQPNQIKLF